MNQQAQYLQPYETIFLQDTFKFQFDPSLKNSDLVFLPQTYKLILQQTNFPVSFGKNDSLLDSAIFERISMTNINPLIYLYQCRVRLEEIREKQWNQTPEIQQLVQASTELITNYMRYALITPDDLFPNREISKKEKDENQNSAKVAQRLLDIFDQMGFDEQFFKQVQPLLEEEFKNEVYSQLLRIIYKEFRQLTIFNTKIYFYLQIVRFYLENDSLKYIFYTQEEFPWIPGPQGITLKKGIGSTQGNYLENQSAFGQFLKISLLPCLIETKSDNDLNEFIGARVAEALQQKQTRKVHKDRVNSFQDTQRQYVNELIILFRLLLKKGQNQDYFAETFRFLTACLIGNVNRTKEGVHLEQKNNKLQNYSSDAFMLNLYDIMLEISRKVFDRQDDTYKKIDPIFWLDKKFESLSDQPMLQETIDTVNYFIQKPKTQKLIAKEAGNVSNLFFYTMKYAHFGLLTTLKNYKHTLNEITEMKKGIESIKDSPQHIPQLQDMKKKLEKLDIVAIQYEACIFDNKRIRDTADLFDTFIVQFVEWCRIDLSVIVNGQSNSYVVQNILNYIPEHLIDDIFEFHLFYAYHKDDYLETNMNNTRMSYLLQMATLLGTSLKIASNKYLEAKFIELTYLLFKIDRKQGLMKNALLSSDFAKNNFLHGLIKFYVDIESTGASHQFYSKFSYRLYVNELLLELLNLDVYKQSLQKYQNDQNFERMIKMIMNDLNYSMDEGWSKLQKMNEEDRKNEPLQGQQLFQQQHQRRFMESQVRSNLSHAMSTIKVVVALTKNTPQVLLSELYRQMIISMFNHFLELLLDRKHSPVIKLIKFMGKQDFKPDQFLIQVSLFYTNLMDNKEFVRSILKDQRSFKLEYFTSLINYLTSYPTAPINELISLTQQLQEDSNEDIDLENLIDIPEKYQDPIQGTLLNDPVKLPSGIVADRASIKMALLDKEEDPWTRKPLKEKDLIEMPELKKEIDQWKQAQTLQLKAKSAEIFRLKTLQKRQTKMDEELEQQGGLNQTNLFQGRQQQFEDEQ